MSGHDTLAPGPDGLDLLAQRDWILRLALQLAQDPGLAEDATQETLLDALRGGWLGRRVSRAFVAGTLRNKLRMRRRTEGRRRARESRVAREEVEAARNELVDQAEAHRNLVEHLLALHEPFRIVLLERYFEGLTPAEIAAREGTSADTVRRRLSRAHAALRERLERDGGEEGWLAALAPLLPDGRPVAASILLPSVAMKLLLSAAAVGLAALSVTLGLRSAPDPEELVGPAPAPSPTSLAPSTGEGKPSSASDTLSAATPARRALENAPALSASLLVQLDAGTALLPEGFELRVADSSDGSWNASFDEEGQAHVAELPAERDLRLDLWRDGEPWSTHPEPLRLTPGEQTRLPWELLLRGVVAGMAFDADGAPAAGEELILVEQRHEERRVLRNLRDDDVVASCTTLEDGSFEFPPVAAGAYHVGPRGAKYRELVNEEGLRKLERIRRPAAPVGELVTLEPNQPRVETTLQVWKGLTIRGTVRYPDGSPAHRVLLLAYGQDMGGTFRADSARDGSFSFGAMAPGEYLVIDNSAPEGWGLFSRPRVLTGTTDLELVLEPAGIVSGTARDVETGESRDGWLHVNKDERSPRTGTGIAIGFSDGGDGSFRADNLEPASYALRYESSDRAFYGFTSGVLVQGGAELAETEVKILPAARLVFDEPLASEELRAFVFLADGRFFARLRLEYESFRVLAVPPGRLRVSFRTAAGAVLQEVEVEARMGEETMVPFQPAEPR